MIRWRRIVFEKFFQEWREIMKNQRMLDELTELMRIDVSSGQEMEIADCLSAKLEQM